MMALNYYLVNASQGQEELILKVCTFEKKINNMEKITKALIDEINDITTYADLLIFQKNYRRCNNPRCSLSEFRLRAAVLESRKQINRIEIETKGKQAYRPFRF